MDPKLSHVSLEKEGFEAEDRCPEKQLQRFTCEVTGLFGLYMSYSV